MNKELLLIVDDESRVLRSLKAVFRSTYQVKVTTSCEEALQIIRDNRVNTIISDQRMPEMRGVDLLNQVKDISPNTMRLLLTGYSDIPSILDAINEGEVYRYITKPWGQAEIQTVIPDAMQISNKLFSADLVPSFNGSASVSESGEADKTELLVLDTENVIFDMVNKLFSKTCVVHYSSTIDASTEVFTSRPVKVVVVNVPQVDDDYLSYLKLIKSEYPQIVTIAVMAQNDADNIINLINQGQIYRYIAISVPPGRTRICIQSAIKYANRLNINPVLAERHRVETNTMVDSISTANKNRIVKSLSLLKRRLFGINSKMLGGVKSQ